MAPLSGSQCACVTKHNKSPPFFVLGPPCRLSCPIRRSKRIPQNLPKEKLPKGALTIDPTDNTQPCSSKIYLESTRDITQARQTQRVCKQILRIDGSVTSACSSGTKQARTTCSCEYQRRFQVSLAYYLLSSQRTHIYMVIAERAYHPPGLQRALCTIGPNSACTPCPRRNRCLLLPWFVDCFYRKVRQGPRATPDISRKQALRSYPASNHPRVGRSLAWCSVSRWRLCRRWGFHGGFFGSLNTDTEWIVRVWPRVNRLA